MKGLLFTEFLDLVEKTWGDDMVDALIETCDPPSGGAYTAVGVYDHRELVAMVVELSRRTATPVPELLRGYGRRLFQSLAAGYPDWVGPRGADALDFLERVESHVHVEVRKLYPDAELPRFDTLRPAPDELVMIYRSSRRLDDVCHGLIEGCIDYFGQQAEIAREEKEDGSVFHIRVRR